MDRYIKKKVTPLDNDYIIFETNIPSGWHKATSNVGCYSKSSEVQDWLEMQVIKLMRLRENGQNAIKPHLFIKQTKSKKN